MKKLMENIWTRPCTRLAMLREAALIERSRVFQPSNGQEEKGTPMDDLLWLAIILGLAAATLAYVRLCDNA